MSDINIIENSIWPTTDGRLGINKVPIPDGVNTFWPEGNALVKNFIYKDDKLVGYIDTKSLIENETKTSVLPYEYVDITLDKRLEYTTTIEKSENCKYFNIKYEICLPPRYKRVDYLESTGTQYINTKWCPLKEVTEENFNKGYRVDGCLLTTGIWTWIVGFLYSNASIGLIGPCRRSNTTCVQFLTQRIYPNNNPDTLNSRFVCELNYRNSRKSLLKCEDGDFENTIKDEIPSRTMNSPFMLFANTDQSSVANKVPARIWSVVLTEGNDIVAYFIPALDPTGAPCMYDIMSSKTFYNSGTGDFIYPNMDTQASTYSLRNRMYAKMTDYGIRRLYHVPIDYSGTKEDYASDYGFKQLVELPKPEEGNWIPNWRETDTELICEWIESEIPSEI